MPSLFAAAEPDSEGEAQPGQDVLAPCCSSPRPNRSDWTSARSHDRGLPQSQQLGRLEEAEVALLEAHRIDPRDPEIIHAVAVLYAQQRRWEQAQLYVDKLIERVPEAPGPRQLRRRNQAELAAGREAP